MRFRNLLWVVLASFLTAALPSASQNRTLHVPSLPSDQKTSPQEEQRLRMEKEMAKKANEARQADLKRDTDKLLKLANELKESVDKTSEGTLSVDVVKKAEEIEKLAHSVKGKMKGAY